MEKIIEFKRVSKSFGDNKIIKDISFSIEKEDFITIIGGSGSGKTTMLKMMNGLISTYEGEILFKEKNILKQNNVLMRRNIGYVIQSGGLFPHMTIEKNINYVLNLNKEKGNRALELMEILGIPKEYLKRYPSELSGGECQRVGIARALAARGEIMLMDEPFGALDEITRKILQDELVNIYKKLKITIVFVTHDIKEALKLATKILVLNKGEIEQFDIPENIVNSPSSEYVKTLVGNNNYETVSVL